MQRLKHLIKSITPEETVGGAADAVVTALTSDSRRVVPGAMFVAVRGPLSDGHDYISAAIEAGASVIVCETIPDKPNEAVTYIRVADSAVALGFLASEWYGNPSRRLNLVGVTGTNGKTTIATLLYEMARLTGLHAGLLSTVENRIDDRVYPSVNTTPSPLEINRLLAEMVDAGCLFAAMEVSSHGMVQRRTAGLQFAGGVFTNLTRDHLDYHGTFKAYLEAKKTFFDMLPPTAFALTNNDDRNGAVMVQNTRARRLTYGLSGTPDIRGTIIESNLYGMELSLNGIRLNTPFMGRFNASNLTAVFGAWVALGYSAEKAAVNITRLVPVAGRFQTFRASDGTAVVVDYAHTPDALENVLATIVEATRSTRSRITTVFGCGGDRDRGKRPEMGAIAARLSDSVIVTSDNPRSENAADIAADIVAGIPEADRSRVTTIIDRSQAIHTAVTEAQARSVVLVAGKGHETYQEFENRRRIHFDDREEVLAAIKARDTAQEEARAAIEVRDTAQDEAREAAQTDK